MLPSIAAKIDAGCHGGEPSNHFGIADGLGPAVKVRTACDIGTKIGWYSAVRTALYSCHVRRIGCIRLPCKIFLLFAGDPSQTIVTLGCRL